MIDITLGNLRITAKDGTEDLPFHRADDLECEMDGNLMTLESAVIVISKDRPISIVLNDFPWQLVQERRASEGNAA